MQEVYLKSIPLTIHQTGSTDFLPILKHTPPQPPTRHSDQREESRSSPQSEMFRLRCAPLNMTAFNLMAIHQTDSTDFLPTLRHSPSQKPGSLEEPGFYLPINSL